MTSPSTTTRPVDETLLEDDDIVTTPPMSPSDFTDPPRRLHATRLRVCQPGVPAFSDSFRAPLRTQCEGGKLVSLGLPSPPFPPVVPPPPPPPPDPYPPLPPPPPAAVLDDAPPMPAKLKNGSQRVNPPAPLLLPAAAAVLACSDSQELAIAVTRLPAKSADVVPAPPPPPIVRHDVVAMLAGGPIAPATAPPAAPARTTAAPRPCAVLRD
jgi:hypothetical protein